MLNQYIKNLILYRRIDPIEYYISDQYNIVYVENAKVACTAIKQVLFPDVDYKKLGQNEFHKALRHKAVSILPEYVQNFLKFSIFRNPAQRLASAYRDKILNATVEHQDSIFTLKSQRLIFKLFSGIDPKSSNVTFENFIDAVGKIPDSLRDRHIASQAPIYNSVIQADRHFVGRLENLAKDWTEIQKLCGIGDLPQLNESQSKRTDFSEIDPLGIEKISRIYLKDYIQIGYSHYD